MDLKKLAKSTGESIAKEIEGKIIKEGTPETSFTDMDYIFFIEMPTELNHELLDSILIHLQNEKYFNIDNFDWEKRINNSRYSIVVDTRDKKLSILFTIESPNIMELRFSRIPTDEELFSG